MISKDEYRKECAQRWHGPALCDAMRNWSIWQEWHERLVAGMVDYKKNPSLFDGKKYHNPDGTLTNFLWQLQSALQPDKSCLHPLIDFEEHFQRCFLRRGARIYCAAILRDLESPQPKDPNQFELTV